MKKIILLSLFALAIKISVAQTPGWLWAESGQGTGAYGYMSSLTIDTSNNLFIAGRIGSGIALGGLSASSSNEGIPFMGRYDTSGSGIWLAVNNISSVFDYSFGIATDSAGNSYDTGNINSGGAIYVDKYSNNGNLNWTFTTGYYDNCSGYGVTADAWDNVYNTGDYSGDSIIIGSDTLRYGGVDWCGYVSKLDSNGNIKWATGFYGTGTNDGYDAGKAIIVDRQGNVYVCGDYQGAPSFYSANSATIVTDAASTAGTSFCSLFIAKYDSSGNVLWVATANNAGSPFNSWSTMNAITIDSCNNLYVAGMFQDTATFGNISVISQGNTDMFVAKYNTTAMQWEWVQTGGGTGADEASGVALDKLGNVYVSGVYSTAPATFGSSILSSGNSFVAKYANSNGALQWIQSASVTQGAIVGVAVDKKNYVYVDGDYTGFGATFGSVTLPDYSQGSFFLAKLDTVVARAIVPVLDSVYCSGSKVSIPYTVIGTFNSGNVFTAQLSDSTGSFANAMNIGDTASTVPGIINVTIPSNTPVGSSYLIRIVSSNPATSSYASGCYAGSFYVRVDTCNTNTVVWPGDANDDLVVNNYDLLPIGLYYGETGPPRDTTTITWAPHPATVWGTQQSNGKDIHYVDCNGDGTINSEDTLAVLQNYGLHHTTGAPRGSNVERTGGAPLYFITDSSAYHPGSLVHVAVWLGNSTTPVAAIYGLGYDVLLSDTSLIQSGSLLFNYNNSFIGTKNTNALSLSHAGSDVETAVVGTDHINKNGYGKIGDLYFTLQSSDEPQSLILTANSDEAVDSAGNDVALLPLNDTITITNTTTSINQLAINSQQLTVYPNPSSDFIHTSIQLKQNENLQLRLVNMLGQMVWRVDAGTVSSYQNNISVADLAEGVYLLEMMTGERMETREVVVTK